MSSNELSFRPYARLLTMLGEQLIKNERVALVELIKNAYDADADRVEIRFEDFDRHMRPTDKSRIIVRDDGVGMSVETLQNDWMNPATPSKHLAKQAGQNRTPRKKRFVQGEKGIGRFAVLQLGRVAIITTRRPDANLETTLTWDFSRFDDEFVQEDGDAKDVYLDQIKINISQSKRTKLPGADHGTIIEITNLKGSRWGWHVIDRLGRDAFALTDPMSRITRHVTDDSLEIAIFCNGVRHLAVHDDSVETLKALIEDKPVLTIRGRFDQATHAFSYETGANGRESEISLHDARITGLWVWRDHHRKARAIPTQQLAFLPPHERGTVSVEYHDADHASRFTCGSFSFRFYIFDFAHGIHGRYALSPGEKTIIKAHRIYLYRDGVRVYPYGDPDDDWLNIDVTRGTGRAGNFFSNDQTIGWIDISHRHNPDLRDKTNRGGLIETGGAADDLIFLVQVFLSYLKQHPFAQYKHKERLRSTARLVQDGVITKQLTALQRGLKKAGHAAQARAVATIQAGYKREKEHLSQRAKIAEDLAGVGLSVEMASHDLMLLMSRARELGRRLARSARVAANSEVLELTDMLVGVLQQIVDGMRDLQIMFKSSRRRRKILSVEPILDKIHHIYKTVLDRRNIRYQKVITGGLPLKASTTDGVVMQVLVNLFDNAAYWLESVKPSAREIRVTVDGDHGELLFSDSGPGIDPDDLPYIFDPFYSGKGQEGRGLGLYIARQLLERHDYSITVAEDHQQVLAGANFSVSFVKEDA